MALRVESVSPDNPALLISYSAKHGPEHDESFLPGRDFALSPEYPAYLLWREHSLVGAVVLMRNRRYLTVRRGRLSIFHSVLGADDAYSALLHAIRPHFRDLLGVYLFIPETKPDIAAILGRLGFHIERFSFVMERTKRSVDPVMFPDGYMVQPLNPSDRTGISQFAQCLNQGFRHHAGHTDSSPDDIRAWFDEPSHVEGGICLLRRNGEPVGTLRLRMDDANPNAAEVCALGIVDQHRGKGLGKALLGYAIATALGKRLHPVVLSVSAENEAALGLYKSEGFTTTKTMVCYTLDCA